MAGDGGVCGIARVGAGLVAFVALAASCGTDSETVADGSSLSQGPEPAAREVDVAVRWESGLLEDLGHSLTIVFTGGSEGNLEDNPCVGEYDVEVQETPESVTITMYALKLVDPPEVAEGFGCDDVGYQRRLGITFGGDGLGDRGVIDGATGELRALIDETAMLMPTELPPGWAEWYRNPQDSAIEMSYGPDGGSGFPPLSYLVAPTDNGAYHMDRENLEWDLTTLEEIGVRGHDSGAFMITSLEDGARTFVFEEGGRHHRVTIQVDIDVAIGLAFIESLN